MGHWGKSRGSPSPGLSPEVPLPRVPAHTAWLYESLTTVWKGHTRKFLPQSYTCSRVKKGNKDKMGEGRRKGTQKSAFLTVGNVGPWSVWLVFPARPLGTAFLLLLAQWVLVLGEVCHWDQESWQQTRPAWWPWQRASQPWPGSADLELRLQNVDCVGQ